MNKGELVDVVAESTKLKKTEVAKVLDSVLDCVKGALKKDADVSLVGFGTWKKKKRAHEQGENLKPESRIIFLQKKRLWLQKEKK